jgi:PAS domain-containing protein
MPNRPLPLILAREFADNVATPFLVLDAEGTLVFFNERAEQIIGTTWAEFGELPEQSGGPACRSSDSTVRRSRTTRHRPRSRAVSGVRHTKHSSTTRTRATPDTLGDGDADPGP